MLGIDIRVIILFQWLLLITPLQASDIYKYTDQQGKIYFSNIPLNDPSLKLKWVRDESKLDTSDLDRIFHRKNRHQQTERQSNPNLPTRRHQYDQLIHDIAAEEDLHPHLLHAVVRAESGYRPQAVSPVGARGLMQLMPATARRFQVKNIHDPEENLRGGARYLRHLLDLFDNDLRLSLAAYNTGEYSPSIRNGRIPANTETSQFIKKVQMYIEDELFKYNKPGRFSPPNANPNPKGPKSKNQPLQLPTQDNWLLTLNY